MVFETKIKEEMVLPTEPKKEWEESKAFREVRFVTSKKGTEFLVIRQGQETWISLPYCEAVIDSGRKRREERD